MNSSITTLRAVLGKASADPSLSEERRALFEHAARRLDADWSEEAHPRAADGKFGGGGGEPDSATRQLAPVEAASVPRGASKGQTAAKPADPGKPVGPDAQTRNYKAVAPGHGEEHVLQAGQQKRAEYEQAAAAHAQVLGAHAETLAALHREALHKQASAKSTSVNADALDQAKHYSNAQEELERSRDALSLHAAGKAHTEDDAVTQNHGAAYDTHVRERYEANDHASLKDIHETLTRLHAAQTSAADVAAAAHLDLKARGRDARRELEKATMAHFEDKQGSFVSPSQVGKTAAEQDAAGHHLVDTYGVKVKESHPDFESASAAARQLFLKDQVHRESMVGGNNESASGSAPYRARDALREAAKNTKSTIRLVEKRIAKLADKQNTKQDGARMDDRDRLEELYDELYADDDDAEDPEDLSDEELAQAILARTDSAHRIDSAERTATATRAGGAHLKAYVLALHPRLDADGEEKCPSCGKMVTPEDGKCPECGAAMKEGAAAAAY